MTHHIAMESLKTRLSSLVAERTLGRVSAVDGGLVRVRGLETSARLGDRAKIRVSDAISVPCEVIQLSQDGIALLADSDLEGVSLGNPVTLEPAAHIAPSDRWLGRLIDPNGQPLDGKPLTDGSERRPLRATPPAPAERRPFGPRLETGHIAFDTVLPIVRGQRVGLFSGSGVGKSSLMGRFAQRVEADVVVVALIGERGREVRHFVDDVIGPKGLSRCVVVAATSDQSPLLRRRCAWTAMAVAEHFRDQGRSVLLVADSITRFAEAHREIAVAAGEAPVLRGYPPSTAHLIMSLCERAGPGTIAQGDITAIFSVLVPGSDMEEPIADILRGVLDGHFILDRQIAERGRFPSVNILQSVSRSLPQAATDSENATIATVRKYLSIYDRNQVMISAGLYTQGSDPDIDTAIELWPELDAAMGAQHDKNVEYSFDQLGLILRRFGQSSKSRMPQRKTN